MSMVGIFLPTEIVAAVDRKSAEVSAEYGQNVSRGQIIQLALQAFVAEIPIGNCPALVSETSAPEGPDTGPPDAELLTNAAVDLQHALWRLRSKFDVSFAQIGTFNFPPESREDQILFAKSVGILRRAWPKLDGESCVQVSYVIAYAASQGNARSEPRPSAATTTSEPRVLDQPAPEELYEEFVRDELRPRQKPGPKPGIRALETKIRQSKALSNFTSTKDLASILGLGRSSAEKLSLGVQLEYLVTTGFLLYRNHGGRVEWKRAAHDTKPKVDIVSAVAEGRRAVARGERPTMKRAIATVMGKKTMDAFEIIEGLTAKNWMPYTDKPQPYVSFILSSTPEIFERVKHGSYKVKEGVTFVHKVKAPKAKDAEIREQLQDVSDAEIAESGSKMIDDNGNIRSNPFA